MVSSCCWPQSYSGWPLVDHSKQISIRMSELRTLKDVFSNIRNQVADWVFYERTKYTYWWNLCIANTFPNVLFMIVRFTHIRLSIASLFYPHCPLISPWSLPTSLWAKEEGGDSRNGQWPSGWSGQQATGHPIQEEGADWPTTSLISLKVGQESSHSGFERSTDNHRFDRKKPSVYHHFKKQLAL